MQVAAAYGVKPIENMLSHELKRNKIDGEKQIIQNPGEKHRQEMEKVTFERFEAYAIDILFSSGEGLLVVLFTQYSREGEREGHTHDCLQES